jgi:hypothetical protein
MKDRDFHPTVCSFFNLSTPIFSKDTVLGFCEQEVGEFQHGYFFLGIADRKGYSGKSEKKKQERNPNR